MDNAVRHNHHRSWIPTILICWMSGLVSGITATLVPANLQRMTVALGYETGLHDVASVGSWLLSLFLVGWVVGGITLGSLADRFSRVGVLSSSLVIVSVSTVGLLWATSLIQATVLRTISGFGVGAVMVISTTLVSEVAPPQRRGLLMGLFANSYPVGIIATGLFELLFQSWTQAFLICGLGVMLVAMSTALLRSSVQRRTSPTSHQRESLRSYRGTIAFASLLFGCVLVSLWSAFSWLPSMASHVFAATSADGSSSGTTVAAFGLGGIIGSLLCGLITHHLSNARALQVSYGGSLALLLLAITLGTQSVIAWHALIAVLGVVFGMSQAVLSLVIPGMFPFEIRGLSVGLSFNISRLLTSVAVLYVGALAAYFGGYRDALLVFSIPLAVGLIVSVVLQKKITDSSLLDATI